MAAHMADPQKNNCIKMKMKKTIIKWSTWHSTIYFTIDLHYFVSLTKIGFYHFDLKGKTGGNSIKIGISVHCRAVERYVDIYCQRNNVF